MKRRGGMTVAEVVIAVSVIGILSLFALPVFTGVRKASLQGAAMNNVRLINAARDSFALTIPDAGSEWESAATDSARLQLLVDANMLAGSARDYIAMPGGYSVQLSGAVRNRTVLLSEGLSIEY